jgi:hypothetical protein
LAEREKGREKGARGRKRSVPGFPRSNVFHKIKSYAVEIAATIVFVWWIAGALWRELSG